MTKDELNALLGDDDLMGKLDIKTLVLDLVKEMPEEEILAIFWNKLPLLNEKTVRDYFYMRRS
ncbi:MAG: hypothetical protein AAGI66_01445 [Cyanobacteria bacterium P01_H01_bin.74]